MTKNNLIGAMMIELDSDNKHLGLKRSSQNSMTESHNMYPIDK